MTRNTDPDASGESRSEQRPSTDGARWRSSSRLRTDGGEASEAAGADDVALDPWGSSTIADYRKLFETFGIEEFDEILPEVPDPHYLMRRGVIFGHRDYRRVAAAMREGEDYAALSGFMPTGDPHVGHKLVFDELIWHQQQGGDTYALIADLEAHSARGLTWDEIDEHARDYVLSFLALGFDPDEGTIYRQTDNRELQDLAFELGIEANFSELQAIYGFDGETDVSHMQSVVTQAADILYPQLEEPKPTVIPVGPDQDPHVRLTRDLATRMRFFGVTQAYASFELEDEERPLLAWLYDELERALGDAAEANGTETDGPPLINCAQTAMVLGGLREYIADGFDSAPESIDVDPDALAGMDNRERSADDWAVAMEALVPFERMPPGDATAATVESLGEKLDSGGREPLRPRVRFLDRNATEDAFEALVEAVEGEKRVHVGLVDAFETTVEAAETLAREVEVEHGGYGFIPPASIYHRFMTGLTGGKMSSSVPASHISLLDDPQDGYDKVKAATTGGRETAEEQRELGGRPDECPVYELYAYLLAGDDDDFAMEVYDECAGGERLCGDCKEQAAELMASFLEDHQEKREEWADRLDELDIDLDTDRKRVGSD
ncbi:MAG TPA: tryptophan--tRNA ligase [Natrialbaceae archaeon]|nr:tryptophan--tRNA ligase [Natrialbaceae archaeon]